MKKRSLTLMAAVGLLTLVPVHANAGSYCNNGSYSANSGRGTCSYNGGVNRNMPSYSDPGSSSYNRNNGYNSRSGLNSIGTNSLTGKKCRAGQLFCQPVFRFTLLARTLHQKHGLFQFANVGTNRFCGRSTNKSNQATFPGAIVRIRGVNDKFQEWAWMVRLRRVSVRKLDFRSLISNRSKRTNISSLAS